MYVSPRPVYGFDEQFMLLPYERGERRTRLVLRTRALTRLLRRLAGDRQDALLGAPVALGELLDGRAPITFTRPGGAPVVMRGHELDRLRGGSVSWQLRSYRLTWSMAGSVRFEAGHKLVFTTHTAYHTLERLLELCEEAPREPKPRTGVPGR